MNLVRCEIPERDLLTSSNADSVRESVFRLAGLDLPPLTWVCMGPKLHPEDRKALWSEAFSYAGVLEVVFRYDHETLSEVWVFQLPDQPVPAPGYTFT